MYKPKQASDLTIQPMLDGEAVAHSPFTRETIALSRTEQEVLTRCDGALSVAELAEALSLTEVCVQDILGRLAEKKLLLSPLLPPAEEGLMKTQVGGETLVYHPERQQACCLNPVAARVFESCDGETALADLALTLEAELACEDGETVVDVALEELEKHHLVKPGPRPARTRRDFLTQTLKAAAVLPIVLSVLAPEPALAQSDCVAAGDCAGNCGRPCDPPNCATYRCTQFNITMFGADVVNTANASIACCDPAFRLYLNDCNSICGSGAGSYCCCTNGVTGSQPLGGPCLFCGLDQDFLCAANNCVGGVCA